MSWYPAYYPLDRFPDSVIDSSVTFPDFWHRFVDKNCAANLEAIRRKTVLYVIRERSLIPDQKAEERSITHPTISDSGPSHNQSEMMDGGRNPAKDKHESRPWNFSSHPAPDASG
ncbi:hypothetical protein TNIN_266701 [Trichonephila inaurata madagascariensis]|uniref:Uncharacterized protein n=1 Tax=Trichonephila inaurata madagascariensis TaxID=2747483 RepID=A0A8X6XWH3_9ARAC|nr:hypothetical protein TNIN_266701 [Trichonephila inaurata madagascariensis]